MAPPAWVFFVDDRFRTDLLDAIAAAYLSPGELALARGRPMDVLLHGQWADVPRDTILSQVCMRVPGCSATPGSEE